MSQDEPTFQSLGGQARAEALSKKQRSEIAKAAAAARWSKPADDPALMAAMSRAVTLIASCSRCGVQRGQECSSVNGLAHHPRFGAALRVLRNFTNKLKEA